MKIISKNLIIAMFAVIGIAFVSCEKNMDTTAPVSGVNGLNASQSDGLVQMRASSSYTSRYAYYYQHVQEPSNACAATSYMLALNMVIDYKYPNNNFACTYEHAKSLDVSIRNYCGNNQDPNVSKISDYFWNNEHHSYQKISCNYKRFYSHNKIKEYIIYNVQYNVIVIPVSINDENLNLWENDKILATSIDGNYIVDENPGSDEYDDIWGHYLILTKVYKQDGIWMVKYKDVLNSSNQTKICTLDRMIISNKSACNSKRYLLLFQYTN